MIYFIQSEDAGNIKIGFTDREDADQRLAQLHTGNPYTLRLLRTQPGTLEDEKNLHRRFASARVSGEWFKPVPELMDLIRAPKVRECSGVGVATKSVQIQVLTVGRKQFTKNLLFQLPEGEFVEWNTVLGLIEMEQVPLPQDVVSGDFWGWIGAIPDPKLGEDRPVIIFAYCGCLYRYQVPYTPPVHVPEHDSKRLYSFWHAFESYWLTNANQLYIGV